MSDYLTKIICVACLFLLSSPLSSQVIIRDSVTIAPKNITLLPKGVVANQPLVDVSFVSSSESLFPGALIQIQMPDNKRWTMIAAPCTGVDSALLQADMGIFPETGKRIGEVLYSSCYGDLGGSLVYSDYFSPSYGESTGISVDLIGVGPNIRYLGYFTYLMPPLPTVAITTTYDSPDLGSLYISDNYQPTIEFTEEHTPNFGERFEPTIEWLTTYTINTGDYLEQVRSQGHVSFPIAVKATNVSGIATDTIWVTLLGIDHFVLVADSQSVEHDGSIYFSVQALDIYGNVIDNYYNPQSGDDYPYNIPLTITWDPDTFGEVKVPLQATIARRNNGLALNDSKKQSFHSPGNISSPKNGTVKVGGNIAATKPITNFPKSESGKGQIQKIQSSSDTTISSLSCTYWDARYLQFVADGQSPNNPTPVTITVTSADGYNRTGIGHVVVNPALPCGTVILSSDHMNPGDTIDVTIKIKINDTTFADFPEGTLFNIGIADDGDYGLLLANGMSAPSFDDVTMPIKFIAADSIDVDSTVISFFGSPEKGSSVSGIPGKSGNKMMLTQAFKPKKGGKKFLAAGNSTCSGPAKETIVKYKLIVTTCLVDILNNGQTSINVIVSPKAPPDGTKMSISVGPEGLGFAKIKNLHTGDEGFSLSDIPYEDIRNHQVVFEGTGKPIPGTFPLGVRFFVSWTSGEKPLIDTGSVFLSGSNTSCPEYTQDDTRWANSTYDSQSDNIGNLGCALTDMANTLAAEGKDWNPLTLDAYMRDKKLYTKSGGVNWTVMESLGGLTIKKPMGTSDNMKNGVTLDLSDLDADIAAGSYIMAQVKDVHPNGKVISHWVSITGKNNGIYSIFDPGNTSGSYCKKVVLDAYDNKIFRALIFSRK